MSEHNLSAVEEPASEPEPQRERSTIGFPYNDLKDGIRVAQAVHGLGDRCSNEQLITPLGYSSVENGAYKMSLAGAKHFGLVNTSKEGVTLTPLGHRIVDPVQEERARSDAFQSVPLYNRLFDEYNGHSLPPTNHALEAVLVRYGVAEKQKDKARQVLMRSAEQAGYFYQGRDRLVLPAVANQPLGSPSQDKRKGGSGDGPDDTRSNTRTLDLVSGGQVSLTLSVDLFELSDSDRKFVLDLVDKMKQYDEQKYPLMLPAPQNGDHS